MPVAATAAEVDAPFQVDAEEVEYQADRDLYVARGNVVLTQEGQTLKADRVYFSNKTGKGVASGNVIIEGRGDTLRAPFLEFDTETLQGVVYDGELDSPEGGYRLQGAEVRKTGDDTYEFVDGRFTTCRCPKPDARDPWAIRAKQARLDLDGYGRARNTSLEVLGVPVMWLPYAVYPFRRERQTGFLFPQFGQSNRGGLELGLPFFWAAADNVNVMLEPHYITDRGFKPSATVEYLFWERGAGEIYGTWIRDKDIESDDPETPFDDDRWGAIWRHKQELPLDGSLAIEGIAVSDNQFPFDFDDFRGYRRDRWLMSTAWTGTAFGAPTKPIGVALSIASTDDLQNPDDQDRDDWLLQRLPYLQAAAMPSEPLLPGLLTSGSIQFVNYQPYGNASNRFASGLRVDDQFYDVGADAIQDGQERDSFGNKVPFDAHLDDANLGGPEGNGVFDEGEVLADHGQRVVARPRIAYPVHLGDIVELYPEAGYYGTYYAAEREGFEHRSLFTGRIDLRAKLRGAVDVPSIGPATHLLEPFIGWIGVTSADQDQNPLFVPPTARPQERLRLLELDNWTLDPSDRVDEANNLAFGVNNRLWSPGGAMLGELSIFSLYEFAEGQWGVSVAQGRTQLPYNLAFRFQAVLDHEPTELSDGAADLSWAHSFGHQLGVGYRYVRDIPQVFENFERNDRFEDVSTNFTRINQIRGNARLQVTEHWALTYNGYYSFQNAISLTNQLGIEYLSRCKCWAIRLEVNEDRTRGLDWTIRYRLVGLGDQGEDRGRLFSN
jgi:lipopolysaccharide assembly outer membrane protein LptD (OstA)